MRHDLDCHDGASDICLQVRGDADVLCIVISNPVLPADAAQAAANPGLGLGLRHTEASLQLAFGPAASLQTRTGAGRFIVELRLPLPPC